MNELNQLELALRSYLNNEQWAHRWKPSDMCIQFLPNDLYQALILTNLKLIKKVMELEEKLNSKE